VQFSGLTLAHGLRDNQGLLRSTGGRSWTSLNQARLADQLLHLMITVVSGIPRSGTSLMMQMMAAGGMPLLTDGQRTADENNPRGYFELESVKTLARNQEVLAQAEGKVVKVISSLLPSLPKEFEYRIIFMCRPLEEVVSSQNRMLERLGKEVPATPTASVVAAFQEHLRKIRTWLSQQPNIGVLYVDYPAVVQAPEEQVAKICSFLRGELDGAAMIRQIERSLHREKSGAVSATEVTPSRQQ
jgi:hypothetical protein